MTPEQQQHELAAIRERRRDCYSRKVAAYTASEVKAYEDIDTLLALLAEVNERAEYKEPAR